MIWLDKIFDFFASLRLAVIVILMLAVISAVGTVVEARFDTLMAQKLVYHSVYMYVALGLLSINLIAVMIDRWPWRPHHAGFVLAHVGILVLLLGSWITQKFGVDGSVAFGIGEKSRYISVNDRELSVYSTFDGSRYTPLFSSPVDFISHPPQKRPFTAAIGSEKLEVLEYHHFALRQSEIRPSMKAGDGPAVRIQLQNDNVNLSEWIKRPTSSNFGEISLGPAKVVLSDGTYKPKEDENVIELFPSPNNKDELKYRVFTKSKGGLSLEGLAKEGSQVETGWMGLRLRVLRYLPVAEEIVTYEPREKANNLTTAAIKIRFKDKEHWLGINSLLRLFNDDHMLVISYGNRRIDMGFEMTLADFRVGRYQGTQRAASYESEVDVPGLGLQLISMNEPLKHKGFTFYQASFEQDETGRPVASILSVNHDPGRWIKYLGSFLIVLGSIVLFYFKRSQWLKNVLTRSKEKVA